MATNLQKAQQAWAWRKALIKGNQLIHVAHSIPLSNEKLDQLHRLVEDMDAANDAKYKALGGNPKRKEVTK